MSETEEAASQTAAEQTASEAQESSSAAEISSAETENTGSVAERSEPGPVPYSRFKEINEERKAFKERLERLEAALAEKEKPAKEEAPDIGDPPEGLSGAPLLKWYTENFSKAMLEREFGMSLGEIRMTLSNQKVMQSERAEQVWTELCKLNQVDPKNPELRKEAGELIASGVTPEKAALVAATIIKARSKKSSDGSRATAETGGLDSTQMAREDWAAWSKEEAVDAAKKGKRMPHMSVEDIFAKAAKRT